MGRKAEFLKTVCFRPTNDNLDLIPEAESLFEEIASAYLARGYKCTDFMKKTGWAYRRGVQKPSWKGLRTFLDEYKAVKDVPAYQTLEEWEREGLFFDQIVAVKPETELAEVFDFVVPDTHSYWANGFVSHNTVLFASLIRDKFVENPASRALVLAHRDELIQQARDKLLTVWPEAKPLVGVVKAEQNDVASKITVASVQSLYQTARLEAYLRHGLPELTVTDEAHHAAGGRTYRRIYETLSLLPGQDTGGRLHLGVTATPDRLDKVGLKHVFDEVVHALTIGFMIESGYLVPVRGVLVNVGIDLDGAAVNPETGDFSDSSLARVMESPAVVEAIARAWVEKGENRKTVAFTPSVRMAADLAEALRGMGAAAAFVSGDTPEHERRELLRQFSDGEIRVLANCMVLTEGFD
ncbi:MAG: DEAD/DEAH box helicase family protein, partial [Desulfofundulus sp.]